MAFQILDGTGKGYFAKVTEANALLIKGEVHQIQHHYSKYYGDVYQAVTTFTVPSSGAYTIMHMKNTSPSLQMCITSVSLQAIGFSGIPDINSYISIGTDTVYSAGGSLKTPTNVNLSSGNSAEAIFYTQNPTVTGELNEFDRWYLESSGIEIIRQNFGSIIFGSNDTLEIRLNTNESSGYLKVGVEFLFHSTT
jgi:hypothetical protein